MATSVSRLESTKLFGVVVATVDDLLVKTVAENEKKGISSKIVFSSLLLDEADL